ncbi:MAG: hypothetical protein ABIF82_14510 [Planctomycetota bacterium]
MLVAGEVVYLPLHCVHFDAETRLCTIYDRRHELNPRCLTVEQGIKHGVFPADCPYVRNLPGYRPPREECTEDALRQYLEQDFDGAEL